MNIKTILIITFSFLATSPVFAATYPEFAGITITKDMTAAQYISYFFNICVAIGAFIAVVMVIMAGIEWLTSSGNPSKVESAKAKIMNTLVGVGVLVGCYFILNTINPQLTNIKIDDLACSHGIVVSTKDSTGKINQECIDSDKSSITNTITSTVGWKLTGAPYLKVYTYSEPNYKGTIKEFDCRTGACSGTSDISGAKSIKFISNNPGIYLYDDVNYKPGASKGYPLWTATSISDLSTSNSFDNFTKSIDIVNPDQSKEKVMYQAVAFNNQGYKGRCAFIGKPVTDVNMATDTGYTDKVDNISSVIVVKMNLDPQAIKEERGDVILYTKSDCGKSSNEIDKKEIKSCRIQILTWSTGQVNILDHCPNFNSGDEVQSFEITGSAGLVLSTGKALEQQSTGGADYSLLPSCEYFDKSSLNGGTCYNSLVGTQVYTVGGKKPQSYIVIPSN